MTSLSAAESPVFAPARARSWGAELVEFLLVGGLTPPLFLLSFWLQRSLGLDAAEYAVGFSMFWAAHVINDPHFAVTYFLFYKDWRGRAFGGAFEPSQRLRYLTAGVILPSIMALWALWALATRSAFALGWMIQLMFLLVGWHYVKQGFGVLVVLAARRGVFFSRGERLALLSHALSGWAYAWASPAEPGRRLVEKGVTYLAFAHSTWLERSTQVLFFGSLLPLAWLLLTKWKREGRLPLLAPLTGLFCSIWSWSIYSGSDPLVRYAVPALHSLQYLYMVGLLKGNEAREREGPPHFEAPLSVRLGTLALSAVGLGWLLFRGGPTALDAAFTSAESAHTELGATPCFAALYAFVNLHHYFMDNVIWRKDNPHTRYLRAQPSGANSGAASQV